MAIFSLSVSVVKRSEGGSAIATASYITDRTLYDARLDREYRFGSDRTEKHATTIDLGSRLADGTAIDHERLWNAAEQAEKRKDGRPARKIMIALPVELSQEQHKELIDNFRKDIENQYKVATTAAIHYEHEHNPHCHLLITTREVSKEKDKLFFGNKTRVLDEKKSGSQEIEKIREFWEIACNRELEKAKEQARIDRRSYKRQGVNITPGIHIGMRSYALARKYQYSERIERAADIEQIRIEERKIEDVKREYRLYMERIKQRAARKRSQQITRQAAIKRIEQENARLNRRLEESRRETEVRLQEDRSIFEGDITKDTGYIDAGQGTRSRSIADLLKASRAGKSDSDYREKTIEEILKNLDKIKDNREVKTISQLLEDAKHGYTKERSREQERNQSFYSREI